MSKAAVGIFGVVGLAVGASYTGRLFYEPSQMVKRVEQMALVQELRRDPRFELRQPWQDERAQLTQNLLNESGGMAPPLIFVDRETPGHVIAVCYCGPRTCGFPFIVHGGVLGTLVEDAIAEAAGQSGSRLRSLSLVYKMPTIVGQPIIIETQRTSKGYRASVRKVDGKTLVNAEAKA